MVENWCPRYELNVGQRIRNGIVVGSIHWNLSRMSLMSAEAGFVSEEAGVVGPALMIFVSMLEGEEVESDLDPDI